ncbi:N-acetylglucosamine kinase [Saccharopolyspora rectivirgula]|jgi:glucosamine kinase|uniref:N-acetylglucosamine kinase n=1 Tax=Saccharopolyspora rectivirgula TaxID=28042 RepID=UPI0024093C77|nr:BadF/BadG/BcrA/BcrD ATPase family protein [Saccharopolyspora rectivirgula]
MHHDDLVLGFDIGGTTTRALLCDLAGGTAGYGEAGGGNPNSHPVADAVREVSNAARQALSGTDPAAVRHGVLGMAGSSKMTDPAVAEEFHRAWRELGLRCPMTVLNDAEVAFAAGTSASSGTVLIAGTGAIASRIEDHREVRIADGYGWLLGDEGSGFWLGREAVRAALLALDTGVGEGELTNAVLQHYLPGQRESLRRRLITEVNAQPPIHLSRLAPLVCSTAQAGDATAQDIVHRAARLLADTAQRARQQDTGPIVLAGGLTAADNPVGQQLRAELAARDQRPVLTAGSGAAGAAWLAARTLVPDPTELHERLVG